MKFKLYIIILLITNRTFVIAQSDTILVGYPTSGSGNSVINEAKALSDNRIIFTQATGGEKYQAYLVDTNGDVIYSNDLDTVDGFEIFSSIYIITDIDKYIFIGNAKKDNKSYCISISLDSTLKDVKLVDTIALEDDTWLSFETMKINTDKNVWETFGVSRRISAPSVLLQYFYASIGQDYKFNTFKKFNTKYKPSYIFEFYWIKEIKRYLFSAFNLSAVLVDEDINFIYENAVKFSYIYDGVPTISTLILYNCTENDSNIVFCYGKEPWDRPYNAAFAWVEVRPDTILLNHIIPLSNPPLGVQYESHMRKDLEGNYLISGADNLPWSMGPANTIKVIKYAPDLTKRWEFTYKDDKGFVIWDMELDHNNDIILVGEAWNMYSDTQLHGFLMKIYANGTLSSYEEAPGPTGDKQLIRITPNPIVSSFCLRTEEPVRLLRFWDVGGRMVWEGLVDRLPYCGALPAGLPPGFYAAEVWFKNGRRAVEKVVVLGQK